MLQKKKNFDVTAELKHTRKLLMLSVNEYLIVKDAEFDAIVAEAGELISLGKKAESEKLLAFFEKVLAYVKAALAGEKPNFFTLGYYITTKSNELSWSSIEEMNAKTREFLDNQFMFDFIAMAGKGVSYSHICQFEIDIFYPC